MKVALINNLYGRHARGGAERVVGMEARGLARRGHEPVVVSAVPKSDLLSGGVCGAAGCGGPDVVIRGEEGPVRTAEYHPPNICFYKDLHLHGPWTRLLWHVLDIWNPRSAEILMRFLSREEPDVIHTHNLMGLGFSIPREIRSAQFRHVHTVHDVQLLYPSGLLPAGWRGPRLPHERLYVSIMRRRMGSPDIVVFPSEFIKELHDRLRFFPGSEKVVLRNPVSVVGRRSARVTGAEPIFLFVGQLEEHKGILDLLDAWMLWDRRGEATLAIVGSGRLEDTVRRRCEYSPATSFLGRLEGEAFSRELDRASCLVVPSRVIENAPTVIVEALARGIPVIAARTGGIPELVRDGENGLLFDAGDKEGLVEAFEKINEVKGAKGWAEVPMIDEHLDALEGFYGDGRAKRG